MNLSRPDRRERLDRLAAEFALGTSPPRVRRRLSSIAQRDRVVADALTEWERRLAVLADGLPAVTPSPRVWARIAARLGLDLNVAPPAPVPPWWSSLGLWRALTIVGFVAAVALGLGHARRQCKIVRWMLEERAFRQRGTGRRPRVRIVGAATRGCAEVAGRHSHRSAGTRALGGAG